MRKINIVWDIADIAILSAFTAYTLYLFHNDVQMFTRLVDLLAGTTDLVRGIYPKISIYEAELIDNGYPNAIDQPRPC